eukprot:scaffold8879_cov44-Attheya_sp.AAC.2
MRSQSIDALALAVNAYSGGLVLVSHDMRLISQVAKEIWICDDKTVTRYKGDIQNFKMDMRHQMGLEGEQVGKLRGDASVAKKSESKKKEADAKAAAAAAKQKRIQDAKKISVAPPLLQTPVATSNGTTTPTTTTTTNGSPTPSSSGVNNLEPLGRALPTTSPASSSSGGTKYIPMHLRNKKEGDADAPPKSSYVPPHLRNR